MQLHSLQLTENSEEPLSKEDLPCVNGTAVTLKSDCTHAQSHLPSFSQPRFPSLKKGGQGGFSCLLDLLRQPGQKHQGQRPASITEDSSKEKISDPEKYIFCRQCNQVITTRDDKISVDGSHYHTCANPHGLVFDIGCFRSVIGCGYAGPPSDEFTWFKGFSWRITVCGMCLTHLGWLFMSGGGDNFHGLILDRIIESSNE